ncbi:MAG: alpha-D-ribose 1-methylphosphonate 5-triphosphate diphosphatase, partial [Pseudomonadota bacterium]
MNEHSAISTSTVVNYAPERVFTNADIVLEDKVIRGTLVMRDGKLVAVDDSISSVGEDLHGDLLIPGLIELHTDHLESHYNPRPGVTWNLMAAVQAHDAQIAASGITTVFDCLRIGSDEDGGFDDGEMRAMADAISDAQRNGRLRSEHRIHLRCEVSAPNVMHQFEDFDDDERVGLVSLMDHAPGQRQFQTMEQYTLYYKTKRGLTDEQFNAFVSMRKAQSARYSKPHRKALATVCRERGIAIASHDDATVAHVDEARELNTSVAEFPTSFEAAEAS